MQEDPSVQISRDRHTKIVTRLSSRAWESRNMHIIVDASHNLNSRWGHVQGLGKRRKDFCLYFLRHCNYIIRQKFYFVFLWFVIKYKNSIGWNMLLFKLYTLMYEVVILFLDFWSVRWLLSYLTQSSFDNNCRSMLLLSITTTTVISIQTPHSIILARPNLIQFHMQATSTICRG